MIAFYWSFILIRYDRNNQKHELKSSLICLTLVSMIIKLRKLTDQISQD